MSITKFNTASVGTPNVGEAKGSNLLLWALGLTVVGYLGYKFWYLPMQEEKKKANETGSNK